MRIYLSGNANKKEKSKEISGCIFKLGIMMQKDNKKYYDFLLHHDFKKDYENILICFTKESQMILIPYF